jgi:hypothetical protein
MGFDIRVNESEWKGEEYLYFLCLLRQRILESSTERTRQQNSEFGNLGKVLAVSIG